MTQSPGDWTTFLIILAVGFAVTEPWRWAGSLLGRRIDPDSEAFRWVRAVSIALIAALLSRMVVFPSGALAAVAAPVRVGAFLICAGLYFAAGRSLTAAILGGVGTLMIGHWLVG